MTTVMTALMKVSENIHFNKAVTGPDLRLVIIQWLVHVVQAHPYFIFLIFSVERKKFYFHVEEK